MEINAYEAGGTLYIALVGEIDEHSAKAVRQKTDTLIDENAFAFRVVFDLNKVSFMDSTGIGFLIGRYKKLKKMGMDAFVSRPNLQADKILEMGGIYRLIPKTNE